MINWGKKGVVVDMINDVKNVERWLAPYFDDVTTFYGMGQMPEFHGRTLEFGDYVIVEYDDATGIWVASVYYARDLSLIERFVSEDASTVVRALGEYLGVRVTRLGEGYDDVCEEFVGGEWVSASGEWDDPATHWERCAV